MTLLQEIIDLNTTEVAKSGIELFDKLSIKFFMRLAVDFIAVFVIIRFIYLPVQRNREFIFTLFIFNIVIFLITYLLNKVDLSMGAAFGLFAVFSMLRYRTEGISIKDMTYLFIVIALGLINAVGKGNWDELSLLSSIVIVVTFLLEKNVVLKKESSQYVEYEKIELIKPEHRLELIADLESRVGVKINHVNINEINFLRDTAKIQIFYFEK